MNQQQQEQQCAALVLLLSHGQPVCLRTWEAPFVGHHGVGLTALSDQALPQTLGTCGHVQLLADRRVSAVWL